MNWKKFGAWMDVSRVHGTPSMIALFFAAMMTSSVPPEFMDFVICFFLIAIGKTAAAVHNEVADLRVDQGTYEYNLKPIQSRQISARAASYEFVILWFMSLILGLILLPPMCNLLLQISFLWTITYTSWGKYKPVTSVFMFPAGIAIMWVSGSYATGVPTIWTWALTPVAFTGIFHGQWMNVSRDIAQDKAAGSRSLPSRIDYGLNAKPSLRDPNIIFGVIMWVVHNLAVFLPYFMGLAQFLPVAAGYLLSPWSRFRSRICRTL